jgi:hypothetical protein
MSLPAELPEIANARLPEAYQNARNALARCSNLDECQTWANKAEALASYAKQAGDDGLRRMADRIQARAVRRCGELLDEIEPRQGANQNIQDGADPKVGRAAAAEAAGLSERQRKTALRVAHVPAAEFEAAVESDRPPTVTTLAERGTQKTTPAHPAVPRKALWVWGRLKDFEREGILATSPDDLSKAMPPFMKTDIAHFAPRVAAWLEQLSEGAKQ